MSEELKETLDDIKRHLDYVEATKQSSIRDNEMKIMYEYITNLQQKVEQLEKENKEIYETQKEYGCRILDACDFIEQRIENKDFDYIKFSMDEIVYLLNILNKGGEE